MSNLKKSLEYQQKITEAVKAVTNYFNDVSYEDDLELVFSAQTQIMGLMELAKQQTVNSRGKNGMDLKTDEITLFMQTVREYLHMLKPFAEMMEEEENA